MSELQDYKCPSCGGSVEFDPSVQTVKCPWCDTELDVAVFETDAESTAPDELDWKVESTAEWSDGDADGVSSWTCSSCGGEIIAEDTTAATKCPWCDNPIVVTGRV